MFVLLQCCGIKAHIDIENLSESKISVIATVNG